MTQGESTSWREAFIKDTSPAPKRKCQESEVQIQVLNQEL